MKGTVHEYNMLWYFAHEGLSIKLQEGIRLDRNTKCQHQDMKTNRNIL